MLPPIWSPRFQKGIASRVKLEMFLFKHGTMKKELAKVPVVHSGVEKVDGREAPFVVLDSRAVLYGRFPSDRERQVYGRWRESIPLSIREETVRVAMDVVSRYLYPHAMPQLTMPYPRDQRRCFHKQHMETIRDLPGLSEEQRKLLLKRFEVAKGESFLDVGAYMGYGTVRMAKELGKDSRIVAVEADPDSLWLLEQNIKANDLCNVLIVPKAVSNRDGMARFHKTGRQANSLVSGIVHSENAIEVPTMTIDGIVKMAGVEPVSRISITINGAEVDAVDGMRSTVERSNHVILSIAGWYKRNGRRISDIVAPALQGYGLQTAVGRDGGVFAWK